MWFLEELCAFPASVARVLQHIAADAAQGTPLPGARLLDDGRVVYGTWEGVPVVELAGITRSGRRPWSPPRPGQPTPDSPRPSGAAGAPASPGPRGELPVVAPVPLVLVDGLNLLYRAVHAALRRASDPARQPASLDVDGADPGVVLFIGLLHGILGELGEPAELVVCLDGANGTASRRALWPSYKATRPPTDPRVLASLAALRPVLEAAEVATVIVDHAEADDLAASMLTVNPGRHAVIVSNDRDFLQLVAERVWMADPVRRRGQRLLGPRAVQASYGVTPAQWCDFRALTGDSSDNLPGVPGVGRQTATKLLAGGRTLEDLARPSALAPLPRRVVEAVAAHLEQALEVRELLRLRRDIPLAWQPTGVASPPLPTPEVTAALTAASTAALTPAQHPQLSPQRTTGAA